VAAAGGAIPPQNTQDLRGLEKGNGSDKNSAHTEAKFLRGLADRADPREKNKAPAIRGVKKRGKTTKPKAANGGAPDQSASGTSCIAQNLCVGNIWG